MGKPWGNGVARGAAYWTRKLHAVPAWALREELERRGDEPSTDQAVRLPGLTVDPIAGVVDWRGEEYDCRGRMMEVLYALALAHADGRRGVRNDVLALRVFRGWDRDGALACLRTQVTYLRARFPGLIPRLAGSGCYNVYRLALDAAPAARAEGVA